MNLNEIGSENEFSADSLILEPSQEQGSRTHNCHATAKHDIVSILAIPPNAELQRFPHTSLSGTVIAPTSPIKSDSVAPMSGELRTPESVSLIPSPPLSPGSVAEIKIWSHDEELYLSQSFLTKKTSHLRRSMSYNAGVRLEDRFRLEDRIRTTDRILIEDCVRLEDRMRMEYDLKESIVGLEDDIKGCGFQAHCARVLGRNVLRPLNQTCKRPTHNGEEPMEPLVLSSFRTHFNASRVQPLAKAAAGNIHRDTQDPFPTLSSQPYQTGKSYPKASVKPPPVVPSRAGSKQEICVTPLDLRCISCGSVSTPCWRPSWSKGKLCNSCGLRYARNRVRCSNSSCSYIPTKTYISGQKRKKCKNCALDFIYL